MVPEKEASKETVYFVYKKILENVISSVVRKGNHWLTRVKRGSITKKHGKTWEQWISS